jgi:hypothetical protein
MRNFTIKKITDLNHVAQTDFMLLGVKSAIDFEINNNWVAMIFDENCMQNLEFSIFKNHMDQMFLAIQERVYSKKLIFPVLFYVWFEEQSLQLSFNVISLPYNKKLFGCIVHYVQSKDIIYKECFQAAHSLNNVYLDLDTDLIEEPYHLNVFEEILYPNNDCI